MARISQTPLDPMWFRIPASCVTTASAQISTVLDGMCVVFSEMRLPPDQRAGVPPRAAPLSRIEAPKAWAEAVARYRHSSRLYVWSIRHPILHFQWSFCMFILTHGGEAVVDIDTYGCDSLQTSIRKQY